MMIPWMLGAAALLGAAYLGDTGDASTASRRDTSPIRLDAEQLAAARIVAREAVAYARAADLPAAALALVLMVNAYGESRFRVAALGDWRGADGSWTRAGTPDATPCSYGLFQLNVCGGAGETVLRDLGNPPAGVLLDPTVNTRGILETLSRQPAALDALRWGTLAEAIGAFVGRVERPRDVAGATAARIGYAWRMSGTDPTATTTVAFQAAKQW